LATNGTITIEDLAGMLYDSLQKIKSLDGNLRIFPGHGSGSACGKSICSGNFCDIKSQKEQNYAFLINDRK
jgi:hydroxyacylglutathione hydrolase